MNVKVARLVLVRHLTRGCCRYSGYLAVLVLSSMVWILWALYWGVWIGDRRRSLRVCDVEMSGQFTVE